MSNTEVHDDAINVDTEKGNFSYPEDYAYDAGVGLSEDTIRYISDVKKEADWIREFRLRALEIFNKKAMPTNWASKDLENIHFDKIRYYLSKGQQPSRTWEEVPDDVKETFERLGIPEQERKFLAGVEAQFDSEAAYSRMKEDLEKEGVIFVGSSEGLEKYPEIFKPFFGKVIP
ncbi:MAG: Fe-S cluster assembly protein SufB, partial [Opitutales bacterium]